MAPSHPSGETGGLGLQSVVKVAPSAFLAYSNATAVLVNDILPADTSPVTSTSLEEALSVWSSGHDSQPPEGAGAMRQKSWNEAGYGVLTSQLLEEARDVPDCWIRPLRSQVLGCMPYQLLP